jgi:hypothetical protein
MEEIINIIMLEEEEDDFLLYCMYQGAKGIFSKKKRWALLQFDRKIFGWAVR